MEEWKDVAVARVPSKPCMQLEYTDDARVIWKCWAVALNFAELGHPANSYTFTGQ